MQSGCAPALQRILNTKERQMADAVIVDDGGSTRIKQLRHKLDALLDNSDAVAQGPFSSLRISCVDENGASGEPGGGGAFPIAMALDDTFKIFSGNHRLEGRIVDGRPGGTATDCRISITGVNNTDPIIEARSSKGQRRYIVSNAPVIGKVEVNAQGPVQTFNIPPGTIYTVVILTA
jgi:hypothetical protein